MHIPPGDAFSRNVSGSVAQPRPAPRQTPNTQPRPAQQAQAAATARQPSGAANSPPSVDRAHAVERIAQGVIPRDVPRGSIIDIEA